MNKLNCLHIALRGKNGCAASPNNASLPLTQVGKTPMSMSFQVFRLQEFIVIASVFKFFYGKEERKGKASRYSKDIFQKMLFLSSAFHVGVNDMRRVTAVS
jgi:hypothetical protein